MNSNEWLAKIEEHVTPLHEDDTMSVAAHKVLVVEFTGLLACEGGVASGKDPEAVHHMRVSCRRIRSAIRLLWDYCDQSQVVGIRDGIQRLGRELAPVRNLDVFMDVVDAFGSASPHATELLGAISERVSKRRKLQQRLVRKHLKSKSYRKTLRRIHDYAIEPAMRKRKKKVRLLIMRHVLPIVIYQQLAMVKSYQGSIEEGDEQAFHRLRIEVKRLRYILTQFSPVLGSTAQRYISDLRMIQGSLGALNDIEMARGLWKRKPLARILKGHDAKRDLLDYFRQQEQRARLEFSADWSRLNSRRGQRNLSDALLVLR